MLARSLESDWPVRPYSTSSTLFLLFVQQTCQNIARISSMSILAIPQDNRMVRVIWSDKNNLKTASIFQIMHKCCVLISKLVNITLKIKF